MRYHVINTSRLALLFILVVIISLCLMGSVESAASTFLNGASACNVKKHANPKEKKLPDCLKSSCVALEDNYHICKCVVEEATETNFDSIIIYSGQNKIAKWPAGAYMGDESNFEVLRYDFDNDGDKELVVANWIGTSNGMGVNYWEIFIARPKSNVSSPLTFSVEDYGKGTFIKTATNDSCIIMTTAWDWAKTSQGKDALYFTGRLFKYAAGALVPVAEAPVLSRRYLDSFAKERGKTLTENAQGVPLSWLNSPMTEERKIDPYFDNSTTQPASSIDGTVSSIKTQTDPKSFEQTILLEIKDVTGKNQVYKLSGPRPYNDKSSWIDRIGHDSSGRLYPAGYASENMTAWFANKNVRVSTYRDRNNTIHNILWVK